MEAVITAGARAKPTGDVAEFARLPVALLAAGTAAILLATVFRIPAILATAAGVLSVGSDPSKLAKHFQPAKIVARVDKRLGVLNASRTRPIWQLTGRLDAWSVLWPQLKDLKA